jgi:hypothetical protein
VNRFCMVVPLQCSMFCMCGAQTLLRQGLNPMLRARQENFCGGCVVGIGDDVVVFTTLIIFPSPFEGPKLVSLPPNPTSSVLTGTGSSTKSDKKGEMQAVHRLSTPINAESESDIGLSA